MKVICKRSCSGPGINLAYGKEYDLTPEQIAAVGSSVRVIEKPKPVKAKATPKRKSKPAPKKAE